MGDDAFAPASGLSRDLYKLSEKTKRPFIQFGHCSKPMSTDQSPPDPATLPNFWPAAMLFLLACVPYWLMMELISGMRCCDPDNNGGLFRYFSWTAKEFGGVLELLFAFNVILLGILLAFLLIRPVMRRSTSGHAAPWESFGAFILFPLSLFSSVYALGLYERYHGWAIAVPILVPPLIGLYGMWARFPHARHDADVTSAVFWGAMLVLTIAPLPLASLDAWTYPDREPERTAKFLRLTPDSTLVDYLAFTDRREEWFEGVRRVKSRQTDAVMLLQEGLLKNRYSWKERPQFEWLSSNLWDLDLEATPSLCEAFHEVLRDETAKIDPISLSSWSSRGPIRSSTALTGSFTAITDVWAQLRTIKWLASKHCDLSDTLTDIETKLRPVSSAYAARDYGITAILNTLAKLRQTH